MDSITEQQIQFELKNRFYYIEYPKNIMPGFWKDREGKEHFMEDMGLDHLKASISLFDRDIKKFIETRKHSPILVLLQPLANQKLLELKEAFKRKVNS